MATGGGKLSEVISDQCALETGPGMYGSGKGSPVKSGGGSGPGPSFKAPPRGGGEGHKKSTKSKTHSEE